VQRGTSLFSAASLAGVRLLVITKILSFDDGFDGVPGIERLAS